MHRFSLLFNLNTDLWNLKKFSQKIILDVAIVLCWNKMHANKKFSQWLFYQYRYSHKLLNFNETWSKGIIDIFSQNFCCIDSNLYSHWFFIHFILYILHFLCSSTIHYISFYGFGLIRNSCSILFCWKIVKFTFNYESKCFGNLFLRHSLPPYVQVYLR